jgi:hypothetical protein
MLLSPSFNGIFHKNANGVVTLEKLLSGHKTIYFMSINSFFNTVSVSRYSRPITVTRDPL